MPTTAVFAVVLNTPNEQSTNRLGNAYPDMYQLNETVSLVRTSGLAETVANAAGIKGENRFASGVVFKLNRAYSGYTGRSVWEWLQREEDSE